MPKDKITLIHQGFAFVEFETVEDAEYAIRIMSNIRLFGRHLKINRASKEKLEDQEFNAKLFVGNLDMEVDEKTLFDTFSQFGPVLSAKVMTEPESDKSRGFGFITYESFESSDRAIEAMNGQYIANRPINVGYAFKKDSAGGKGERHGSQAERDLAAKSAAHRIRAPIVPPGTTLTPIPAYLGGRVGVSVAPPPPPPSMGQMSMPPPPPPHTQLPSHLQHHPSRPTPGGYHQGAPPPPPPNTNGYGHQPPPPPPSHFGVYGIPPPPSAALYPPPPSHFRPPLQMPYAHQAPPPPGQFGYPPPPFGAYGVPPPPSAALYPPPPGQFGVFGQPPPPPPPGHFQGQMQYPPGQH